MPPLVTQLLSSALTKLPHPEKKAVYLTFDDGPHPEITPWVIEQLAQHHARATFFLIGQNMDKYPDLSVDWYRSHGHAVGHHTYNHLNGLKTSSAVYYENVEKCARMVGSDLFRPPYGKMKPSQYLHLAKRYQIVLWHLVTYDFDKAVTPKSIVEHVSLNAENGSIIVFHDSEKAYGNLKKSLPEVLKVLHERGFEFEVLQNIFAKKL
ncbi:polysaccharide deacetylase [Thermaurantimonas aggregans]|uniref:Polysaccharide deacetylase n=2 Tax=Thermaurantimonas aggregans TaxID=2173829 RepID=A0A401XLL3_9FLAO|nr:polysaccharide deacetylase [Thermaurantimonas aggregans]